MSRYIDADALKNKITELDGGSAIDGMGFDIYTCEVFELIDEVPTADVVEVVHGECIPNSPFTGNCSVCGADVNLKDIFCSKCGAIMNRQKD